MNLLDCRSIEDIRGYLINYRDSLSWKAEWILGGGWNRNVLSDPMRLNRYLLDEIWPDTPVALFSRDYHAKLLNSKALAIAGMDHNYPDPAGGTIERDAHGEPPACSMNQPLRSLTNTPFYPRTKRL
ncbi:MAG: amidohydrolase family protein [Candidatus Cloacimonetes bacterium]|nr:amidohydrolase family protein [Candidatus Cloacimonadota bacterium]